MLSDTPDRTIVAPSLLTGQANGELHIFSPDGEQARISLVVLGETFASADGFRRAEYGPHTWLDALEHEVLNTFGSFLANALEDADERAGWDVLDERADDYACAMMTLVWDDESC